MTQNMWVTGWIMLAAWVGGVIWWLFVSTSEPVAQTPRPPLSAPKVVAVAPSPQATMDPEQLPTQQQQIAQQVAAAPLLVMPDDLSVRPDFVSEIEWAMLQGAANNAPDPQASLRQLVNTLRFNKMLEHWQRLSPQDSSDQRQRLAQQLLADLPAQSQQVGWPEQEWRLLQAQLVDEVEPNVALREARLQQEQRRVYQLKHTD